MIVIDIKATKEHSNWRTVKIMADKWTYYIGWNGVRFSRSSDLKRMPPELVNQVFLKLCQCEIID